MDLLSLVSAAPPRFAAAGPNNVRQVKPALPCGSRCARPGGTLHSEASTVPFPNFEPRAPRDIMV